MARYLDLHPDNPQPRVVDQIVEMLRDDALIAYPTDSGYALGCQLGNNAAFRAIKAVTPGPYTFILPATREVPRRLMHAKKKTVGVRIPDHVVACALLEAMGEPILTSTLTLPGETEPRSMGWDIKEELDNVIDAVVESGECPAVPTTVVDYSDGTPTLLRRGAGDPDRFED